MGLAVDLAAGHQRCAQAVGHGYELLAT